MISKLSLLAGASVGVAMSVAGTPAAAATKPAHHAKRATTHRDAEIEALRAQVEALTARLDAQEANSAQASAAISSAQTQAAAANTAAQAAEAQAAAVQGQVPVEVKTALASQAKPKPQWFDSTTISGRLFVNASHIEQKVNGVKPTGAGSQNGTGFNIKRMYVGIDHTFSPIFSGTILMDVSNVVGQTSNTNFTATGTPAGTNLPAIVGKGFYLKKAYIQAKLDPALIFRLGSADNPWIPWIENQYGYRHIENTLIDRISYGQTSDWGAHVLGDLAGGLLSYQFSATDGGGYRQVKITNTVDIEGRVSASYKGFFAGVGGYRGKRASDTQGAVLAAATLYGIVYAAGGPLHTATRLDAAGGYKNKLFTLGGEYFYAKNWNNVTTAYEDKSDGYSLFGNVNFAKRWSVFGRYDYVKPNKLTDDRIKDRYYNAGIQWEPVKIVDLALVYKHENVLNGVIATQNGTIGGVDPGTSLVGGHGSYDEVGLFGQFRF